MSKEKQDFSHGVTIAGDQTLPVEIHVPNSSSLNRLSFTIPIDMLKRAQEKLKDRQIFAYVSTAIIIAAGAGFFIHKARQKKEDEVVSSDFITTLTSEQNEFFATKYEEFKEPIYRFIFKLTRSPYLADELTAETFYSAYNRFSHFVPDVNLPDPFKSWVFQIAVNKVLKKVSKEKTEFKHTVEWDELDDEYNEKIAQSLVEKEQITEIIKINNLSTIINQLPDRNKIFVWLSYVEKLTEPEIGEIMKKTTGSINALRHRTLTKIRELIKTKNPD